MSASASPRVVQPMPPLRNSQAAAPVVLSFAPLTEDDLSAMRIANVTSPLMPVGRVREATQPVVVGSDLSAASSTWRWRGTVRVEGASRVRLRLEDVRAGSAARFWIYGGTEVQSFTSELAVDGTLWTPSVSGEEATLEIESTGSAPSFKIVAAADIREPVSEGTACLTDARCFSGAFPDRRSAYAVILFASGGTMYTCSGALLNDDNGVQDDMIPFFLTANHCISTASEAASVEAFWDYDSAYCNAPRPSPASLPRSNGAALLVTSEATDVTLLRLNSIPGGRWLLGWDPRSTMVAPGTTLYRISYPNGVPSSYSQSVVTSSGNCSSLPRPSFLYSSNVSGGTDVGSSGAPVFYYNPQNDGAYVVGQLYGACGPNYDDVCDLRNNDVDGSFAASWPLLQPFLRPSTSGSPCVANSTTSCLLGARFEVTIDYRNQFASPAEMGRFATQRLDPAATNPDTAIFGFGNPKAVEAVVRIVDARPFAPRFDVYHGGLTDVEYWVNVRDTKTGVTRRYHKAPGEVAGGVDRVSFPTP